MRRRPPPPRPEQRPHLGKGARTSDRNAARYAANLAAAAERRAAMAQDTPSQPRLADPAPDPPEVALARAAAAQGHTDAIRAELHAARLEAIAVAGRRLRRGRRRPGSLH